MSMDVAFRVDAAGLIGTGHFMRCLTLAEALQRRGARVRFVSRDLPAHLQGMLAERAVACVPLHDKDNSAPEVTDELAHAHWLGTSQAHDARCSAQALADKTWDWLIVDHYALDQRWEAAMRGVAHRIMAI
ncbi:MAG: UDP-2,4-diacetamido-2,4,6-trideoxy-beta-L-altropyranose hydrolase, partial [Ideonella sp.]